MEHLTIVKVGGAIVEESSQLTTLLKQFAEIEGKKILVHGGGRRATKLATTLGVENRLVNGRRITNEAMLEVVTMVYGGFVNKTLVARLRPFGLNTVGLTGADMGIITATKRPLTTVRNEHGENEMVDFGFVGDVNRVDAKAISNLLKHGFTPIIAPLTYDFNGTLLNTNADTIASEVAVALATDYDVTLVFTFEKKGVLRDENDETSLISVMTSTDKDQYVSNGIIKGGMLPKIENAFKAVECGVKEVKITCVNDLLGGTTIHELS